MKASHKKRGIVLSAFAVLFVFITPYAFSCSWCNNIPPVNTTKVDISNSTEEPVNLRTGNQFLGYTDLEIPARGIPLELSRTYSSRIPFSLRGWFWESGQWQVENGVYDGQGGRILTNTGWSNFTLTLFMKTISSDQTNPWEAAYVNFRYQGLKDYYYFLIDLNGQIELSKWKDGLQTILIQKPSAYSAFNNNKIEIQAQGPQIYIYVNDNLEISYNDPDPLYSGKIGLDAGQYNHSQFSSVSISGSSSSLVDDFSGENWSALSGVWKVEDQRYSGQDGRAATVLDWTDTTIDADIITSSRGPNPWDVGWIEFRYTNPQNYYYFSIHTDGTLDLSKWKDGIYQQLTAKPSTYDPLNLNHVKIENTGANIKVYIGAQLEIDYTDSDPLIEGNAALDAQSSRAYYKNVAIQGASIFKDTFDAGSGDWQPQSGTWAVESGEYSGALGLSLLQGSLADFVFSTDVKTVTAGSNPWDTAFLAFRYNDNQNYYYLLIKTDGVLELSKWKNGTQVFLSQKSTAYNPLNPNNVKVEAAGPNIRIFVNSALEIDYIDQDPILSGNIGFWAPGCHAHYDNATITRSSSVSNGFRSNTDWQEAQGVWRIEGGEYSATNGLTVSEMSSFKNFTFDVDMKTVNSGANPWDTAWINFRYVNSQNNYYFLIHTDGTLELAKRMNGVQYLLFSKSSAYSPFVLNHIKVDADLGDIKIYVNSNLEIDYADIDPLVSGSVGLNAFYCHAHFDNVNAQDKNQAIGDTSGEWVGIFGKGWQSNIETRLEEDPATGDVAVYKEEAIKEVHTKSTDNTYVPPKGIYEILTKTGNGFTLKDKSGTIHSFDLQGKLTSITDRNDNSIVINYTGLKPVTITDASGRSIALTYNSQGYCAQAQDPLGRTVSYAYDAQGNLTSVTDPKGNATAYGYDPATGNMTSVTDKNGYTLTSTYYYNDQTASQTDALGNTTVFAYDMNHAYVTNAKNDTYVYKFDWDNNLISVTDPSFNIESYTYDSNRNKTSFTDKNGHVTAYTYDSKGNVLTKTDALGNTTTFTYEPNFNQITSITDAKGAITTNEYDVKGNLIKVTNPQLNISTFTYNVYGELLSKTDALGNTEAFAYDQYGNLISVTDPLGGTVTYTYNIIGRRLTQTDARNNTTAYAYDANSNVIQITDALNNITTLTYNKEDKLLVMTDAQGNATTNEYDSMDNIIKVTDAQNNITQYTYDLTDYMLLGARLKTSVIDAKSNTTTYAYDKLGRLIGVQDALLQATSYTYDAAGNRLTITDAKGNTTTYIYDALNRLIKTTFPDGSFETYSYDSLGNMTQKLTRKGDIINFAYDSLNRLITKSYPDLSQVTYAYDALSRLLTITDQSGAITHVYDALGRLTSVTYPNAMAVSYQYDAAGNRIRLTYPNNDIVSYAYDALNRLTAITTPELQTIGFTYDSLNRRLTRTLPNGTSTSYAYDSLSRTLSLINRKAAQNISFFNYTYDELGNRLTKQSNEGTHTYTYDNIYQLTNVQKPDLTTKAYNLDSVGNRVSVVNGATQTYTANNLNQYTTVIASGSEAVYSYDLNGNITNVIASPSDEAISYAYDYENRLISASFPANAGNPDTVSYSYDPFGRRIKKSIVNSPSSIVNFIYDGDRIIAELDQNNHITRTYLYGTEIDEILTMSKFFDWGRAIWYYNQDALCSVVGITDWQGNLQESYTYDEYGSFTIKDGNGNPLESSPSGNRFYFTGREYDSETGLYYYRARYYDPSIGRFLQTDPIGYEGGINLYRYVKNNPVNWIDPYGLLQRDWADIEQDMEAGDFHRYGQVIDAKQAKEAEGLVKGLGKALINTGLKQMKQLFQKGKDYFPRPSIPFPKKNQTGCGKKGK